MNISMLLDLAYPITNGFERAAVGNVVYEDDSLGSAEVGGGDGAESFLACGIPDLEFDPFVIDFNVFDFEVDSDCGDEGWGEGVVCVPEEETGLSYTGISYH